MTLPYGGLYNFSTNQELFGGLSPKDKSWFAWSVLMKVYDGIGLNRAESKFFREVSGGLEHEKGKRWPQNWMLIIGRGGGKTRFISRIIPYRALTFKNALHPGQKAENTIIAPSLTAGMTGFEYVEGMLEDNEVLYGQLAPEHVGSNPIIKNSQMARMNFKNRTMIRLTAVTRISGRGRSIYTLVMEEAAHFKTEGRFSDEEVYKSARPAMGRFGTDSMCFVITTPWTKDGLVWKVFKKYYGVENNRWLVIRGTTKQFNPLISDEFLSQEESDDPLYFQREYLADFVDAIAAAFSADAIEDCTITGRSALPPKFGAQYFGYVDPASLSQSAGAKFNDEFVSGVAHCERGKVIIDAYKSFAPEQNGKRYLPDDAISESIELFSRYGVHEVKGDHFASGYIEPKFVQAGFAFEPIKLSKSDLYVEMMPMLNDGNIELLDCEYTNSQLKRLERRRGRNGRDRIDHVDKGHDDRANMVAGLVYMGKEKMKTAPISLSDVKMGGERQAVKESFDYESPQEDWSEML